MIDREKAIEAAMAANGWWGSGWRKRAERIVDAVLALPVVIDDTMVERAAAAISVQFARGYRGHWCAEWPRPDDSLCCTRCDEIARAALEAALNPPEDRS